MMRTDDLAMPVEDLSPSGFAERLRAGELWQLLDVREAWEVEVARLEGAIHIPMAEISQRLAELDTERPVAVLCHAGVRSAQVAQFLARSGFSRVGNIAGGIDRWSTDVDAAIARY